MRTPGPLAERFWKSVDRSAGQNACWIWFGAKNGDGYGRLYLRGAVVGAHRVSWLLANGQIPDGQWVLHSCDNPPCVNPAHLRLGTHQDNCEDAVRRRRHPFLAKTHCPHGHEYTLENTYFRKDYRPYRQCRACTLARAERQRITKRAAEMETGNV